MTINLSQPWGYAITPVSSPQTTAVSVAPVTSPEPPSNALLDLTEIRQIQNQLQAYASYPGVGSGVAELLSNGSNPEQLTGLMREMAHAIEQVQANPHREFPVHPAIAAIIQDVRAAELTKPDPLNGLRPDTTVNGQVTPDPVQQLVTGAITLSNEDERMRASLRTNPGASPSAVPFSGVSTNWATTTDNLSLADALDYIREAGPTPGLPDLTRGQGRGGPNFA